MTVHKIVVNDITRGFGMVGGVLYSRPLGRRVREEMFKSEMNKLLSGDILAISFRGVEFCDGTFADEVVLETQKYFRENKDNLLICCDTDEGAREGILMSISHRKQHNDEKVPVLFDTGGDIYFEGPLEPKLSEAFDMIKARKRMTAREYADALNINIPNASTVLRKLYEFRLVFRQEEVFPSGKQHIYIFPKIDV